VLLEFDVVQVESLRLIPPTTLLINQDKIRRRYQFDPHQVPRHLRHSQGLSSISVATFKFNFKSSCHLSVTLNQAPISFKNQHHQIRHL
jgi:hypothetical protein